MSKVEEKARDQARKHASKFWDENSWEDILEKYAEVSNRKSIELGRLAEREERGARIEDADTADYYYYEEYSEMYAFRIANSELSRKGYELDKHNNWILKKLPQPSPVAPKKKFGFWR